MNEDQTIWLLITTFLSDYYISDNVFLGNQNYVIPPKINDYAIITPLDQQQKYRPSSTYDSETQEKVLSGYKNIDYQIDLYGENASIAMDRLYTILSSVVASNWLMTYNMGIGAVIPPQNLTKVNDRDNFLTRYTIKFTAQSVTEVRVTESGIAADDITIDYKELT